MTTLNEETLKKKNRERNKFLGILACILIILLPMFTYILHQFLTLSASGNYDFSQMDFSYIRATKLLLQDKKVQQMALGIVMLYIATFVYLSLSIKQMIAQVDVMKITDDIEKPVPAGNGQHGKERFLYEKEKKKLYRTYILPKDIEKIEPMEEKPGIVVDYVVDKKRQIYRYIPGDKHSLIISITGGGKTRRVLIPTIVMQIIYGLSVVASDVKGELFYFTSPFAKEMGYEVIDIDFRHPDKGKRFNFLQLILDALRDQDEARAIDYTWDLVSVLVGEPKGDPLWTNGEAAAIASSILAVAMEAPEECRNMTNVYYFIAYMCKPGEYGELPLNKYLKKFPYDHPCRAVFAMAELAPHKTRASFFTTALGTLKLFTNPNIAAMTSCSDFDIREISKKKTIVYMISPDEKKTYNPLVSLLITQIYMTQVEVASQNGLRVPVDTDFDLDEVFNFPKIPVLPQMVTAGRSRGIRVHLVAQEYAQFELYKEDAETLKTNCEVKVFLKSDSNNTLKEISEKLGNYTVEVGSASMSVSDDKRDRANYSSSSSLTGTPLLSTAEMKRIKPPYALIMQTGEYSAINTLPDLSKNTFNEVLGLGDEEFNRQLIIQRESERESRPTPKISLWGIWKLFEEPEDEDKTIEESNPNQTKRISFLD